MIQMSVRAWLYDFYRYEEGRLAVCRYVDQGGGKRKGAFAIYLEPWHADIFDWLDLRKNHGKEEVTLDLRAKLTQSLSTSADQSRPLCNL